VSVCVYIYVCMYIYICTLIRFFSVYIIYNVCVNWAREMYSMYILKNLSDEKGIIQYHYVDVNNMPHNTMTYSENLL
jgi:hypothetical protein